MLPLPASAQRSEGWLSTRCGRPWRHDWKAASGRELSFRALGMSSEPLSSADDPALTRFVTHVSAGLNSLVKRNRVRQVGSLDSRAALGGGSID